MAKEDTTIIGAGLTVEGQIEAAEGLSVVGRVDGKIQSDGDVHVDRQGPALQTRQ